MNKRPFTAISITSYFFKIGKTTNNQKPFIEGFFGAELVLGGFKAVLQQLPALVAAKISVVSKGEIKHYNPLITKHGKFPWIPINTIHDNLAFSLSSSSFLRYLPYTF